jgi:hypothetical protein
MFKDPEKEYKERCLIENISRLEKLIDEDLNSGKKDSEFCRKAMDSIDNNRSELKSLWKEMREDNKHSRTNILLQWVLYALASIAILLAIKL